MALYKGSCHCGKTQFEVEGELKQVLACNCSICSRKGSLLWFVPWNKFTLKTPESNLKAYEFNKHVIKHKFCTTCGIHSFAEGIDKSGNRMAAINARSLEGIDLKSLAVKEFNGKAL